jgi:biopolymer transport protein ExbB
MYKDKRLLQLTVFIFSLCATLQVLAQDAKAVAPIKGQSKETIFALLFKGGPIMIPLAICSVVALTIAIERVISLRVIYSASADFLNKLKKSQDSVSKTDFEELRNLCKDSKALIAKILDAGIVKWQASGDWSQTEKSLEDNAAREVGRLKRSLRPLKNIAAVSPLLGLLGTVFGMIRAFQNVALSSATFGKADRLASGIYEAMVTTAVGLSIAIPTLLFFYFLTSKVETHADDIETVCDNFLDEYIHKANSNSSGDKKK